MKTAKTLIGFIAIISMAGMLAFTSCSKERLEDDTDTEYAPMDGFYTTYAPHEQTFIIDSTGGDTIIGEQGTMIWGVPKTIFMDKITYQDISYPYFLKLIEAYSIKDMILSQLPNDAQDQLLKTAGEIKITAFKNSNELALKQNCGLHYFAPSASPDTAMDLFYGFTDGTTNDWNENILQTDYLFSSDSVSELLDVYGGYQAKIAKLGWTSIDRFYNGSSVTDLAFTAAGTNTNYIDIYVIFNSIHSFIKVSNLAAEDLPVGEPVTVFALAMGSDGTMYYYKQDYTIASGLVIDLQMTASTETDVLTLMGAL
jgi:hypothetical protein